MKLTGMERPVDVLGRVVIPREIRKRLQIEDGKDSFDIFFDKYYCDGIVINLLKYHFAIFDLFSYPTLNNNI